MEVGHSLKRRRTKEDVHEETQVYATESGRWPTEGMPSLMKPIGVVAACTAVLTSLEGEIVSDEVEFRDESDPDRELHVPLDFVCASKTEHVRRTERGILKPRVGFQAEAEGNVRPEYQETSSDGMKTYKWLEGTRHMDDNDGFMYEVKQVYHCKRTNVTEARRVRINRMGVKEDAGFHGCIRAAYAAYLTRLSEDNGWCSRYRRLFLAPNADTGILGVVSDNMIRHGEIHHMDEACVMSTQVCKKTLEALSVAASYGDIVSLFALDAGVVKVDIRIPMTHKQVLRSPQRIFWEVAEASEMESFRQNGVMVPSWLPPTRRALRTKWIYTLKYDTAGLIKKYKARLVARGFEQEYGVDFDETFSPVTRLQSLRLLFALSAQLGLLTHQMDVKTAFLNADLDEETYIEIPEGIVPDVPCDSFLLKKALYGLKQSPRLWNININSFLLSLGFQSMPNEPCLYMRRREQKLVLIALYVDDLVIAGSDLGSIQEVKNQLNSKYQMADLGEVHQILGCEVTRESPNGRVRIIQRLYIRMIIKKFFPGIQLNSARTPMCSKLHLSKSMCPSTPEEVEAMRHIPYRQAIGCLLWLAMGTRSDIAYAVAQVARFCENPGRIHWEAVCRIFRYLIGTEDMGIEYSMDDKSLHGVRFGSLDVYSDSDHARCIDTRRSVTGFVFFLAGGPICWQSRQQHTVALSSMEAEYMAACATVQEALWLVAILECLGFSQSKAVPIYEDNQSAIAYSKNPTSHKYTKHIDMRYHFVREQVELKKVELIKIASAENVADIFTKPLDYDAFWKHATTLLRVIPSEGIVDSNVI